MSAMNWAGEDRSYRPDPHLRQAIQTYTGGLVPAESWLTEEERAKRDKVQPFEPDASDNSDGGEAA